MKRIHASEYESLFSQIDNIREDIASGSEGHIDDHVALAKAINYSPRILTDNFTYTPGEGWFRNPMDRDLEPAPVTTQQINFKIDPGYAEHQGIVVFYGLDETVDLDSLRLDQISTECMIYVFVAGVQSISAYLEEEQAKVRDLEKLRTGDLTETFALAQVSGNLTRTEHTINGTSWTPSKPDSNSIVAYLLITSTGGISMGAGEGVVLPSYVVGKVSLLSKAPE